MTISEKTRTFKDRNAIRRVSRNTFLQVGCSLDGFTVCDAVGSMRSESDDASDFLQDHAFYWEPSKEGHSFWWEIYRKINNERDCDGTDWCV